MVERIPIRRRGTMQVHELSPEAVARVRARSRERAAARAESLISSQYSYLGRTVLPEQRPLMAELSNTAWILITGMNPN